MTHAFDDILRQRARRRLLLARSLYLLRISGKWVLALAATAAVVVVLAGLVEARRDVTSSFHWPWEWLVRLGQEGDRPVAPLTGALLVVFCGGWFTLLGVALLRLMLRLGYGPLAIARTVVDEAIRNKTVLVLLGMLLLSLAIFPYFTTAASEKVPQPLRYQIQSFLSFSALITSALLGAVTILFAAYSVSTDINVRRTGDVFVKPIRRISYLFGKWLGVAALIAVILAVQVMLVWGVTRLWLGRGYAIDTLDQSAIHEQVLVARLLSSPAPPESFEQVALEQLQVMLRDQPDLVMQRGAPAMLVDLINERRSQFMRIPWQEARQYKYTGLTRPREKALELERRIQANAAALASQLSALLGTEVRPQDVSLTTLAPYASALGIDLREGLLQLRMKVTGINTYASAAGTMDVSLNGNTLPSPVRFVIDRVQIVDLPASFVNEDGSLVIELRNVHPDSLNRRRTVQFDSGTWLYLYHMQGDFAPNLVRGGAVTLVRLAFLAMLGVATGALWSFPVAATFSTSFWILAGGGTWLMETLGSPSINSQVESIDTAFNSFVLPVIRFLASLLSRYGMVDVSGLLVEGRYISYQAVVSQVLWVGVVWMGLLVALGAYFFWRREIARVQV